MFLSEALNEGKMTGQKIILLFSMLLLFNGCPLYQKIKSTFGKSKDSRSDVKKLEEVVNDGGVPSSSLVNSALDESLSAPKKTACQDCGEEVKSDYRGDEAQRFQATKEIALDILSKDEVTEMDQLQFADKDSFCPNYDSLDKAGRLDFWATLVAVMGTYESENRPGKTYDEGRTSRALRGVTSVGVLQMSYGSSRQAVYQRNGCQLDSPEDLHDPRKNISCGLAAMKYLIDKDGYISRGHDRGAAKYWSVLRNPYRAKGAKLGKRPEIIADLKNEKSDCFKN